MKKNMMKWMITSMILLTSLGSDAQEVLRAYINEGLLNNIVLKEKTVSLEKSLIALKEAKSLFLPSSNFEGTYTVAGGGRSIGVPVGDLMNPVYQTLNQLTGSEKFPSIQNVSEQLLPNNYYDVRIKTTMPIINPDLRYNRNIKSEQVKLQQNEIDLYKRELIKEIKVAYYNLLAATEAISIFENAMAVLQQNVRVNQSLLSNGKGLPAYVSRSESELKKVESELQVAKNSSENAKAYFNFLLNKPLDYPVQLTNQVSSDSMLNVITNKLTNVATREELKSLKISGNINENLLKMNHSFRTPRLNAFVDLGAQGFDFKVNNNALFYVGGLQVTIPIFQGKRNLYKIEQTQWDIKNNSIQKENTQKQLELAAHTSRNNVLSVHSNYLASQKQLEAARQYFKLIDRGYTEGVNSFIEFLDARNQLTSSQLQVNITKYKLAAAVADYERQTASYIIN
jgi:outer membrane protein